MANQVYANGMEIACKAGAGKSICAFPDVCFTPPQTPATPPGVPIPYPNTGMASDTTDGSKKVKISDKEVMLKNKSYFKKSSGDEAGSAPKKGLITSKNTGKVYFNMWSMDVKVEGENVVRHFDLTTHNHGSFPGNSSPWPYLDEMAFGLNGVCEGVDSKFKLVPYKTDGELTCKPKTGHHLIPGRCMRTRTQAADERTLAKPAYPEGCSHDKAPCVCATGKNQHSGEHRECHKVFDPIERTEGQKNGGKMEYSKARDAAAQSAAGVQDGKEPTEKEMGCIKQQLDNYYNQCLKNQDGSYKQLKARQDSKGMVLPKSNSGGSWNGIP